MRSVAVGLIEPQYHVNVGHVARLMKNFGHPKIFFIDPQFDRKEAKRYSMHGKDLLQSAKVATLEQLRRRFDVIIGTTAISAGSRLNVLRESISPTQLANIIHDGKGKKFCILLGRESSGMKNKELAMCDLVCVIDTKTNYKTVNVAHALAIILYEISKLRPDRPAKQSRKKIDLASQQDIELLLQYVRKLALAGNYDAHKIPLLDASVKKLIAKSNPTDKDVMLLVSLMRKSLLAIEREKRELPSSRISRYYA